MNAPLVALPLAAALLAPLAAQQRMPLELGWTVQRGADEPEVPARVGGAFEKYLGVDFDGAATYRCRHELLDFPGARVRVEFAAVATHATVYCNGVRVGEHLGGWTPFQVDITAARKASDNVLEVVVDERVGHNTQGFLPIIQPHFGGIWQGVTICFDDGPVIDRDRVFLFGTADGRLRFEVPVIGADAKTSLRVELYGTGVVSDGPFAGELRLPEPRLWSPETPVLYPVHLSVHRAGRETDFLIRKTGFRSLAAEGTRVLWNGAPLQLRGILHWGYSPPHLAPPTGAQYWRSQLLDWKALGFNCVKCCLWVPPRCFYELCDELGLLVWQEYPTWHPQMDQAHKEELLTEYGEFFVHDRSHPSVAFRSITCETGQGADLDVVKSLYDACKAAVPDTLVVDDSSWIGWQRVTDFWDEHPYGNNSWFPGRLEHFLRHIEEKGRKPLLLGECITGDTWVDRAAWTAAFPDGEAHAWHRPICWDSQVEAERWLVREFGQATLDSLLPISLDFAHRNRRFQIEQLRLRIPEAGYVVSVARDIAKCRMGLYDSQGDMKWTPADWGWHRDTMLCLDLPWNGRAMSQMAMSAPIVVSHFGSGRLEGTLRIWSDDPESETRVPVALDPGQNSEPIPFALAPAGADLKPVRVFAELTGTHAVSNHWDLWRVPVWHYRHHGEVTHATELTAELLEQIENGAKVLLHAGDRRGSVRTEGLWFLRGAPFAPPHPIHKALPRDALLELSSFDLETGRVMPWAGWRDQVDPILAFWETHDIPEVRFHLLAFETTIGKGRLLATTLNLDHPQGELHSLGFHASYLLEEHLVSGPPPQRALSDETIAALRAKLSEKKIDLPTWRFRTDPDDHGRAAGWSSPDTDASTADWRDLQAGSHWENQGEDLKHYTGVAWYRVDVEVPADWQDLDARAVFEGVDDSFECWLNGESVGRFGDPATNTTIWLERQVAELGRRLRPGAVNTLVLRVVDHAGAGGLWKPVFLTTGPTGEHSRLLH